VNTNYLLIYLAIPAFLIAQEANSEKEPDLKLVEKYFEMSPQELLNLPTSITTGANQDWLQTPAAVYLLTKDEMTLSGHTHIAEQLRHVPGLQVSNVNTATWAVSTRSFQTPFADKQLVLQDGREIYTPIFGGVNWENADLPVEILENIEVTRGPGATLWGSNAVNGIINIRTLRAENAQENVLSIGGGNANMGQFSFRQGGEMLGGHYYTWGKWASNKRMEYQGTGDKAPSELRKVGFRADLPGFGEEGWTFRAEYFDHATEKRFRAPVVAAPPNGPPPPTFGEAAGDANSQGAVIHGSWKGNLLDKYNWQLYTFYNHIEQDREANSLTLITDTFEVDFRVGTEILGTDLLAGIRHRTNHFEFDLGPIWSEYAQVSDPITTGNIDLLHIFGFPVGEESESHNSFFIQDTVHLRDDLHLLFGTKFEDNESGEQWAPSARLWWNPDVNTTYWFSFSVAHQLPTVSLRRATSTPGYFQHPVNGIIPLSIRPNPNLEPSELHQWEVGWRKLFSNDLSVDVSAFLGDYGKLFLLGNHLAGNSYDNVDSAETYGGEIAINWKYNDQLQTKASVSYSDTEMEGPGRGTAVYSSAKWRGNLGFIFSPDHQFSHHLHFYATERAFPTVPGYIRTDIGTTWRPNDDWELSLHIFNLFDPQHPEFHSLVNGGFVHEVPRTAYLQVRRWF
jgi:iron complex outermembrane receptor protein